MSKAKAPLIQRRNEADRVPMVMEDPNILPVEHFQGERPKAGRDPHKWMEDMMKCVSVMIDQVPKLVRATCKIVGVDEKPVHGELQEVMTLLINTRMTIAEKLRRFSHTPANSEVLKSVAKKMVMAYSQALTTYASLHLQVQNMVRKHNPKLMVLTFKECMEQQTRNKTWTVMPRLHIFVRPDPANPSQCIIRQMLNGSEYSLDWGAVRHNWAPVTDPEQAKATKAEIAHDPKLADAHWQVWAPLRPDETIIGVPSGPQGIGQGIHFFGFDGEVYKSPDYMIAAVLPEGVEANTEDEDQVKKGFKRAEIIFKGRVVNEHLFFPRGDVLMRAIRDMFPPDIIGRTGWSVRQVVTGIIGRCCPDVGIMGLDKLEFPLPPEAVADVCKWIEDGAPADRWPKPKPQGPKKKEKPPPAPPKPVVVDGEEVPVVSAVAAQPPPKIEEIH